MVIFLQEDHELPLDQRPRDDPRRRARRPGRQGRPGRHLRSGLAHRRHGDEDGRSARRVSRRARGARGDGRRRRLDHASRFDVLKGDFDAVFPIFVELLQQAGVPAGEDRPGQDAGRTPASPAATTSRAASSAARATKLGYGADSPYARQPEYATIAAITRDDLLAFHDRTVASEQHHPGVHRRLRLREDGEEAARHVRLLAARNRRSRKPAIRA